MNTVTVAALIAGGLLGAATVLLVWQFLPATPALGPALARLRPGAPTAYQHPARRRVGLLVDRLVPEADLAVLDRTRGHYLLGLGLSALIGFTIAPLLSVAASILGFRLPFTVPAVTGLALAAGAILLTYGDVTGKAAKVRAEYRRGVCVYLDQVALSAAAGHGPVESLERAAAIGHGPVFDRIRATLDRARIHLEPPWEHLRDLSHHLRVPALGDLGDIMQASGVSGAYVYRTLRAKTSSLRTQIRYDELAEAKAGSTTLDGLGAALVLVLLLIAVYPFITRLQLTQ